MRAVTVALLALICGQAAASTATLLPPDPLLAVGAVKAGLLAGPAIGAGLAAGAGGKVLTGAALPLAADAAAGLPVYNALSGMKVPENFTVGSCSGNRYCYPKYNFVGLNSLANTSAPVDSCPDGYTFNTTQLLGRRVCTKQVYIKTQTCFRSTLCPAEFPSEQTEQLCMPKEVRSCLIGMLVVFHTQATLPFRLLPALGPALVKAALFPVILPGKLSLGLSMMATGATPQQAFERVLGLPELPSLAPRLPTDLSIPNITVDVNPEAVTKVKEAFTAALTYPVGPESLIRKVVNLASAGQEVADVLINGREPMTLLTQALFNINMTELMSITPTINAWVSEKLEKLTNANEVTAEISSVFPTCLYRCCESKVSLNTTTVAPTPACPIGTKLAPFGRCVDENAGYSKCPLGMTKCSLPMGQVACVAEDQTFGLSTCRVLGLLQHALPKDQCPSS